MPLPAKVYVWLKIPLLKSVWKVCRRYNRTIWFWLQIDQWIFSGMKPALNYWKSYSKNLTNQNMYLQNHPFLVPAKVLPAKRDWWHWRRECVLGRVRPGRCMSRDHHRAPGWQKSIRQTGYGCTSLLREAREWRALEILKEFQLNSLPFTWNILISLALRTLLRRLPLQSPNAGSPRPLAYTLFDRARGVMDPLPNIVDRCWPAPKSCLNEPV